MIIDTSSLARSLSPVALAILALTAIMTPARAATGPFENLAGAWSGRGSLETSDGRRERLRCQASYAVGAGGSQVAQTLRCASDSYRFDVSSNVTAADRGISGTWRETSRGVSGNLSGRASGGQIEARISGGSFSASLALSTRGNRQTVSIRSPGSELSAVSVVLSRSR